MSKFSLEVLNRCVYPYMKSSDPDVIMGAVFGEDVSLTRIKDGMLVSHIDPIVGAVKNIGWLAVHVACNDIATSGTRPRWILILVLVPNQSDESLLMEIMRDVARAAGEIGVSIIGGHSGYSSNLTRPLVAATALGTMFGEKAVRTRGARVGDHILVTKGIAIEGTAILADDFADKAQELGLSDRELNEARQLITNISVIPEALVLARKGATAMHDVTRGGLLETLLEIAHLSNVGIKVHKKSLPIPSIVSRFSEAFQFDPLKMISSGTLVATIPPEKLDTAKTNLKKDGIHFCDIGQIIQGRGVRIVSGGEEVYHREIHCEEDELARMWDLYHPYDPINPIAAG